jgi:hypothetical protein
MAYSRCREPYSSAVGRRRALWREAAGAFASGAKPFGGLLLDGLKGIVAD